MENFTHQEIARIRYAEVLREARHRHVVVEEPKVAESKHRSLLARLVARKRLALRAAVGLG